MAKKKRKCKKYLRAKFVVVMDEFRAGNLTSSSGEPVTSPKRALAIAYSTACRRKKKD